MFSYFNRFEKLLWLCSVSAILVSFVISGSFQPLYCVTTLIGVTALLFLAKGNVIGQLLTVVFSLLYGWISFRFGYYGEMITYLGMTAPMAILATIQWFRHPFEAGKREVAIAILSPTKLFRLLSLTLLTTALFYGILAFFGTTNLILSTLSVATSFTAVALTFCRSHWYAIAYALNDVVLIALWTLATVTHPPYLTMVLCFVLFLANDLYGFYNWKRMKQAQADQTEER